MKIHTCEQRSEEWYQIRKGKMTASNAAAIASNGKGLETYIYSLMAEKYSTGAEEGWTSADMQRGIDQEAQARMTYEIEYESVTEVGFVELDEHTGCSPDGLVGEDGGIEIKCVNDANFFKLLVDGEKAADPKYMWQVQMCLLITGRKWWDLIFYSTNFEKNMIVFRIFPEMVIQEKLIVAIEKGKKLIQELDKKYADRKI
jgi:putative phage-type endonuclease